MSKKIKQERCAVKNVTVISIDKLISGKSDDLSTSVRKFVDGARVAGGAGGGVVGGRDKKRADSQQQKGKSGDGAGRRQRL